MGSGMSRKKVTVVGSGFVGSTTAQRIVDLELADVVVTDILDGPPAGKALDMLESGPITRTDAHALGISTANLVDFLRTDPKVWEQANQMRARFGQKPLRHS